jgi:hypothetical protein
MKTDTLHCVKSKRRSSLALSSTTTSSPPVAVRSTVTHPWFTSSQAVVIFLDVDILTLQSRVADFGNRGLAKAPDQSFAELFQERVPLYRKHADISIECAGLTQEGVCVKIMEETGS